MRRLNTFCWISAILLLAGCAGHNPYPLSTDGNLPADGPVVPGGTVRLGENVSMPLEKLVYWGAYGAAAYLILDPLNPNWEIEMAPFPEQHYHFALKMKRFYAGGAGEARQVFHQKAREQMRRNGYEGYRVLEYSEGLDSSVLGSQRVARGVIQLTRNPG